MGEGESRPAVMGAGDGAEGMLTAVRTAVLKAAGLTATAIVLTMVLLAGRG